MNGGDWDVAGGGKRVLAGVAGFEPAAYGFGDRCSTSLSYTPARPPSTNSTLFSYS